MILCHFHTAFFFLIYQNTVLKIKCKLTFSGTCQRDRKVSSDVNRKIMKSGEPECVDGGERTSGDGVV